MQGDQHRIKSLTHMPWIRLCNMWPHPTWPLNRFHPRLLPSTITATMTSPTPCVMFLVALPLSYNQTLTLYILPHLGEGNQPQFPHERGVVQAQVGLILYTTNVGVARCLCSCSSWCPTQVIMPRLLNPIDFYLTLWDCVLLVSPFHSPHVQEVLEILHFFPERRTFRRWWNSDSELDSVRTATSSMQMRLVWVRMSQMSRQWCSCAKDWVFSI